MALHSGAAICNVEEQNGWFIWTAHFDDMAGCAAMYQHMNEQVGGILRVPKSRQDALARSHVVSMRLEGLPGLKQRLQAGKNTWPSIGAGSVSGVILGPLVMRHCYFGGFGLGHQFDSCA